MQNLVTVASQVGVLFALMGVGALCRRLRLVDEVSVKGMVNVLILVVTPCLIVDAFQRPFDASMLRGFGCAFLIAFLAHVASIALSYATARGGSAALPVLRAATVFSNAGYMGIHIQVLCLRYLSEIGIVEIGSAMPVTVFPFISIVIR